jgi:hypothetical protein
MKKFLFFSLLSLFFSFPFNSFSQPPSLEWQKSLGGTSYEQMNSIDTARDGGYILAGFTASNNGNVNGNHGSTDYWVVKLSNTGSIQWQKCFGGQGDDIANSIKQTSDGGYIVAGTTSSNDGDVSGNHNLGIEDYWIVKLTSAGNIQWQKCFGGTNSDVANSIDETIDGGYIVAGKSKSNDGDVTGNHGDADYWIVKMSSIGNIQWQKSLGGSGLEEANSIKHLPDGSYIIAGSSQSNDGNVSGYHGPNVRPDFWVVKLNNSGQIVWANCYGGSDIDQAYAISPTSDNGYIVSGLSYSKDGDVSQNFGFEDYWIVKLNSTGAIEWQKSLGGSSDDIATSIQPTNDLGYVVAGYSNSVNGNVSHNIGGFDYWIVKLGKTGTVEWEKNLGGTDNDKANSLQLTKDGGYILAGAVYSTDGDVSGSHGGQDSWVAKLLSSTLPVTLFNFSLEKKQAGVLLEWETASEQNSAYFNIERSEDGIHFEKIGKQRAAGNSNKVLSYSYNDAITIDRIVTFYYRLEEVDFNGKTSYSKIEKIGYNYFDLSFVIMPNPVRSVVNIKSNREIPAATIRILDLNGRTLFSRTQNLHKQIPVKLSLELLAPGIHIIEIESEGIKYDYKILKQ